MAQIANTRKVFNFIVEIAGINQFEIQKVTLPEVEVEKVEHGDTNHSIKTAGRITFGDLVLEKIRPLPQADVWAWTWLTQSQNAITGGGLLPINFKRTIVVKEMDNTGNVAVNRWICEGCWVTKVAQSDFDRMSSDNIVETITLNVDKVQRV